MNEPIEINKGGENWFTFSFRRGKSGLEVSVKAHPQVEEFLKALGNWTVDPVEAYGKQWYSMDRDKPLLIYKMGERSISGGYTSYRLDMPGHDLIYDGDQVNLSFLRIQGISEGITFGVKGAYSLPYILDLKNKIAQSARQLARDYVVPVRIILHISSQELIGAGA